MYLKNEYFILLISNDKMKIYTKHVIDKKLIKIINKTEMIKKY